MTLQRRQFLHLATSAATLAAMPRAVRAETYPARPVRIVDPYPAGLTPDIMARLIGQWLSEHLGQQFIVDTRPGASGSIGTEVVVRSAPDGYTLLLIAVPNAVNAALYQNLTYNFIRDITPVASLVRGPLVMEVHPSVPVKTVREFIAYAKANPGKINVSSGGVGTPQHMASELFKMMAGVDMVNVPNVNPMPDLLGGQVQAYFGPIASSLGYIQAGKLRALAVTSPSRSQVLPDVPTVSEFVPGYAAGSWYGIGAPRTTPAALVEKLNSEINAGLGDPALKAHFAKLGVEPMPMSQTAFDAFIANETDKWGKVVKFASIKVN